MSPSEPGKPSQAVREHRSAGPGVVGCAVVSISDTRTEADDASGKLACRLLREAGHRIVFYQIVADDADRIARLIEELRESDEVEAIVSSGGTGLSPRDVTFEALSRCVEKPLPGFGELFRALSFEEIGPAAMLSRALAGVVGGKILFALPGSRSAVELALERLVLPELGHIVGLLGKDPHGS